jgi:hypothetical protein
LPPRFKQPYRKAHERKRGITTMRKLSHLGIGVVLLLFFLFWCLFGIFMFVGYTAFGSSADAFVVLWAAVFLASILGVFSTFRRALRASRNDSPTVPVTAQSSSARKPDVATPDQRLAHLVKKTDT